MILNQNFSVTSSYRSVPFHLCIYNHYNVLLVSPYCSPICIIFFLHPALLMSTAVIMSSATYVLQKDFSSACSLCLYYTSQVIFFVPVMIHTSILSPYSN
uniref:Uncharacterized protein n=1 Tax=Arundo donax TaxID=35708 RepID=A0A0A9BHP1_ARUDO